MHRYSLGIKENIENQCFGRILTDARYKSSTFVLFPAFLMHSCESSCDRKESVILKFSVCRVRYSESCFSFAIAILVAAELREKSFHKEGQPLVGSHQASHWYSDGNMLAALLLGCEGLEPGAWSFVD